MFSKAYCNLNGTQQVANALILQRNSTVKCVSGGNNKVLKRIICLIGMRKAQQAVIDSCVSLALIGCFFGAHYL